MCLISIWWCHNLPQCFLCASDADLALHFPFPWRFVRIHSPLGQMHFSDSRRLTIKKKEINKAQSLQQTFEREVIENCTDKWRRMLSHIEKWPHSPPATLSLSHAINWRVRHGRHTPAIYWEPIKNCAYTKRIMLTFFSGSNMFVNLLTDERVAVLETPLNLNAMQYCYKRQCCEW